MWSFANSTQRRCHPTLQRQSDAIGGRLEFTHHTVWFRKFRCTQEHLMFYALTYFFLSISGYKRSARSSDSDYANVGPSADDSQAVRKLTFTPSNETLPKSVINFNGSQKEQRSFTAALLVHLGPLLPGSGQRHPRRPYRRQQAPRPTFCSRLALQRTSLHDLPHFPLLLDFDLRETFFRRPPSCVLFFGRLQYHPF